MGRYGNLNLVVCTLITIGVLIFTVPFLVETSVNCQVRFINSDKFLKKGSYYPPWVFTDDRKSCVFSFECKYGLGDECSCILADGFLKMICRDGVTIQHDVIWDYNEGDKDYVPSSKC